MKASAPPAASSGKINLVGLDLPELEKLMTDIGEPAFRATQVWSWMWGKLRLNFADMSDVSLKCRAKLSEIAEIALPQIVATRESADGSRKFLLRLEDGEHVETVLLPSEGKDGKRRLSQCLSSQAGCGMGCAFCATGSMGLRRNLTRAEILGQVLAARLHLGDSRPDRPILRNLVFMGMGEPLANVENLLASLRILNNDKGANFSPRRITVSTCGLKKGLEKLGRSGLAYLAVSLHAPDQALRERLMPKAAAWPLEEMLAALAAYPLKTRERITFEYLLLKGVNDSPGHAKKLAALLGRVRAKLNLIVYNPVPGLPFSAPDEETVMAFEKILWDRNVTAIRRKSRGADIAAACGQLRAECAGE